MFGTSLRRYGILGINARNLDYIFASNPRQLYRYADNKLETKKVAQSVLKSTRERLYLPVAKKKLYEVEHKLLLRLILAGLLRELQFHLSKSGILVEDFEHTRAIQIVRSKDGHKESPRRLAKVLKIQLVLV